MVGGARGEHGRPGRERTAGARERAAASGEARMEESEAHQGVTGSRAESAGDCGGDGVYAGDGMSCDERAVVAGGSGPWAVGALGERQGEVREWPDFPLEVHEKVGVRG